LDADEARLQGLNLAVELWQRRRGDDDIDDTVIATAARFAQVLYRRRPHRLVLTVAPNTFEQGQPALSSPTRIGEHMSVTLTDTEQVQYTVAAEDSKGFPVSDSLTWSESSAGATVTLTPSADGLSAEFVAVAPGSSTITVTDGTLTATDSIDVVAGAASQLVLTPGTPEAVAAAPAV